MVGGGGGRSALYTVKLKFGGDIWGEFVPYYIPEGGYVPYFFPDERFYSGQPVLHFIYLINLIGQK